MPTDRTALGRVLHPRTTLAALVLAAAVAFAPPASAAQPMDRLQRLIEAGKPDDAVEIARKWLEKHADHDDASAVRVLLSEAAWRLASEDPELGAIKAWRAEFGAGSPHSGAAFALEANLAWFAAQAQGLEDEYRRVRDEYPGTAASGEAALAAADVGLATARDEGTTAALSHWLSRYPEHPDREAVQGTLYQRLWTEAESIDTVAAWLELRATSPDHPRAREAKEREALAALQEAGQPDAATLLDLGRRYAGTEAGRVAWRRALHFGRLRLVRVDGPTWVRTAGRVRVHVAVEDLPLADLALDAPLARAGLVGIGVALDSGLPRGTQLIWRGGEGAWATSPSAPEDSAGGAWAAIPAGAALGRIELIVHSRGEIIEPQIRFELTGPDGAEAAASAEPPATDWLPLTCDPAAPRLDFVGASWEGCTAWVHHAPEGAYVLEPDAAAAWSSPVALPAGVSLPSCPAPGYAPPRPVLAWLGGAGLPVGPIEPATAEAPVPPAGPAPVTARPLPAWLGTESTLARSADLDGDGRPEAIHVVPRPQGSLLVVLDGADVPLTTFVAPLSPGADIKSAAQGITHDGCHFGGVPARSPGLTPATKASPR